MRVFKVIFNSRPIYGAYNKNNKLILSNIIIKKG